MRFEIFAPDLCLAVGGLGFCGATPGGTASPGSMSRVVEPLSGGAAGWVWADMAASSV
jgi:hypothetical protein